MGSHRNIVTAICVLVALVATITCEHPGLRLRISQKGLDYAGKQAVQSISSQVIGQTFPDYHNKDHVAIGKVDYKFTGMHVVSFGPPTSTINVVPGVGITWSLTGAAVSIHGDWWYSWREHFVHHHSSGSFDITASGISLSITITLGDSGGRPTIAAVKCTDSVGNVDVKFHHGDSWLLNLFRSKVEHSLKSKLQDILCASASKAINEDAAKKLASLNVTEDLGSLAVVNYSLVAPPVFGQGYVESLHKAEVTIKGDTTPSHVKAGPLPEITDTGHMLTFWLSDYIADTAGDVFFRNNWLNYNISKDDLAADKRGFLNTTCDGSMLLDICIGQMIVQFGKKYPNCSVVLTMDATEPLVLTFENSVIGGAAAGDVRYYVKTSTGKMVYALTTHMTFTADFIVRLSGTNLTANIAKHAITVNVTDMSPEFGPIPPTLNTRIHLFFDMAVSVVIDKLINGKGAKGFSLPKIHNAEYTNPEIKVVNGSLVVMTDVQYSPTPKLKKKINSLFDKFRNKNGVIKQPQIL